MASIAETLRLRRRRRRIDRLTLALAVTGVGTSAAVIASEFQRRFRRRVDERHPRTHLPEGPVEALQLAGRASQDTLLVAYEGYAAATRREAALFNLFSGFVGAFAWARISTTGIRSGWWPFGNVRVRGRHIHHFVPGITVAFISGTLAIVSDNRQFETLMAIPFGAGVGLTMDEAALLVDLQDVYWLPRGRFSIQVSFATVSVLGATILAMRLLRRGEVRVEEAGLVPAAGAG